MGRNPTSSSFSSTNILPMNHTTSYLLISDLATSRSNPSFDYHSLLTIKLPTLLHPQGILNKIKKSKHPTLSVTLTPSHGDPLTLPAWIFCYWTEIRCAMDIQKQWRVALIWVQINSGSPLATKPCQALLLGLSSFSWSWGAAHTKDITSLLSNSSKESYLSSYHIDHMMLWEMTQCQEQHGPWTQCH
jgi:hypothetical protein